MCSRVHICPETGDRLIHQRFRGPHEASSEWLQHLHDDVPHVMDVVDTDAWIVKRSTGAVRWIEHKENPGGPNGRITAAQEFLLPIIARAIAIAMVYPQLPPMDRNESGAFLVRSVPPHDVASISRLVVTPSGQLTERTVSANAREYLRFKCGNPVVRELFGS